MALQDARQLAGLNLIRPFCPPHKLLDYSLNITNIGNCEEAAMPALLIAIAVAVQLGAQDKIA